MDKAILNRKVAQQQLQYIVTVSSKLIQHLKRDHGKNVYERRVYESVDDENLS